MVPKFAYTFWRAPKMTDLGVESNLLSIDLANNSNSLLVIVIDVTEHVNNEAILQKIAFFSEYRSNVFYNLTWPIEPTHAHTPARMIHLRIPQIFKI